MAKKDDESVTDAPDPWAVLQRLTEALEAMKAQPVDNPDPGMQAALTAALERLADAQVSGSKLIADETRRAHRPSNEVVPGISVFQRRGRLLDKSVPGPHKPPLKCLMMLPWLAEWDSLTREEVELLNLLEAGTYTVKKTDNSKTQMVVQIKVAADGVTPSSLLMNHDTAFNNDNFRMMPPLAELIRQMLKQHDRIITQQAAAILTDDEEEAMIAAGDLLVSV